MEWTDDKDVILLREMLVSDLFTYKNGTTKKGKVWDDISDKLNAMTSLDFCIKEKDEFVIGGPCFKKNLRRK